MAGYVKNRENNNEIKYLRKVLGQVDSRIQVPESVSADSLRRLLDDVEAPSGRATAPRRPRRLSLQSGIAYAAAFALIVALFYSTRLYRPDMISSGLDIPETEQQAPAAFISVNEPDAEASGADASDVAAAAPKTAVALPDEPPDKPAAEAQTADESGVFGGSRPPAPHTFGVGGSGKATLLLERDEYAFYWRKNDENDPDRTSPISFEVVDSETQEIVAQADVPLADVAQSFELGANLVFIGAGSDGGVALCSYDISTPEEELAQNVFEQEGELIGANVYNGLVHIVSLSGAPDSDSDAELLPNCVSSEACVITIYDPGTQETVTKRFIGANGTIQLHNLNAYIRYTGEDEDGESKDYIAQVLFDSMDITLGPVS